LEDRLVEWTDDSVPRIELEQMVNLDRGDWFVVLLREKIRTHDPRVSFLMLDEWIGAGCTRWTDENHANQWVPSSFVIRSSV
jgi:hypothetical protein